MSFCISNIIYTCQGDLQSDLLNKSNVISSILDFTLITGASIIGGLMLGGILNFGLPMGIGTSNYLAWGCVGAGGIAAIADIITAIVIKSCKAPNINSVSNQSDAQSPHLDLEKSKDRQKSDAAIQELHNFLFLTLINSNTIQNQPLGLLLTPINIFLINFNKKYNLDLKAIGSAYSSNMHNPWQTIKIVDKSINNEGKESIFLNHLNDYLHETFGIISNGGDSGSVVKGKKKQAPVCFIKKGVMMHPQIQISRIDIKKILGITSEETYFQELQAAYKPGNEFS